MGYDLPLQRTSCLSCPDLSSYFGAKILELPREQIITNYLGAFRSILTEIQQRATDEETKKRRRLHREAADKREKEGDKLFEAVIEAAESDDELRTDAGESSGDEGDDGTDAGESRPVMPMTIFDASEEESSALSTLTNKKKYKIKGKGWNLLIYKKSRRK